VAYNFSTQRAYVISTGTGAENYGVYEVNLANGNALRHKSFPGNKIVSVSIHDGQTLALGHTFEGIYPLLPFPFFPFLSSLLYLSLSLSPPVFQVDRCRNMNPPPKYSISSRWEIFSMGHAIIFATPFPPLFGMAYE
jgi:hypothetical protein